VDGPFLERLHRDLPFDPLTDQFLHQREHSIEFQAVFLRHVLDRWDERRIVPILCCFPWTQETDESSLPYPASFRRAFTERLASLVDEDTLVVAGVDLAHVGKRFGDGEGNVAGRRAAVQENDHAIMERIAANDLPGFRDLMDRTRDGFRICGYPAIVTLLEIVREPSGEILDYGQAIEETSDSLVSFAAMVLR
jgi:AmmeMemoRadiSam system protein B